MDLRHLRYFIAIAESGSLTQAAKRLHIVQPALSQRLSDLEGELGVQLLVRGRLGVAMTPAGEELYARAKIIAKHLTAAELAVKEKGGEAQGDISIGLLRTLAPTYGGRLFMAIKARLPGVVPKLRVGYSSELGQLLRAGQLDIAMQVLPPDKGRKAALYSERLCVVGCHRNLPQEAVGINLPTLENIPLVLSSSQPAHSLLLNCAKQQGVPLNVIGGIEDTTAVLDVCASGMAVTVLSEWAARKVSETSGLRVYPLNEPDLVRYVALEVNPDLPKTSALLVVEELIVQLFRDGGEPHEISGKVLS